MKDLFDFLVKENRTIVISESITGGGIQQCITAVAGASRVLWGGFVTYSNDSKNKLLGVRKRDIKKYDPVSKEVALAMSKGGLKNSSAFYSFSITGYAGPDEVSGNTGKVFMAITSKDNLKIVKEFFYCGSRDEIRAQAVDGAILFLEENLLK